MTSKLYSLEIIIPTYKPDEKFHILIERLNKQTIKPDHIWIINTQEVYFDKERYENQMNMSVIHITKEEFDHGKTRDYGASLSNAKIKMFMTQDAIPDNKYLIENILKPFEDKEVGAVYARQLTRDKAPVIEQYTRQFNYPEKDSIKSIEDLEKLGIKTYFCSNVCAAYRADVYDELGGFVKKTIFNEDMIMASKIIQSGKKIAYASEAKVIHYHVYSYKEQFMRNFDMAVSQQQYKEVFHNIKSEKEGIQLVKDTAKYLIKIKKPYLIFDLIMQSGFKYLGFKLGSNYEKLPMSIVRRFSMNKSYWS